MIYLFVYRVGNLGRKYIILGIMLVLCGGHALAQQDKLFTQYLNYPSALNPAYAGSRNSMQLLGVARKQWVGIQGAPESAVFSVNSPISFYNLGVGLNLESDRLGLERNQQFSFDLSYRLKLWPGTFLNMGLKSGFSHYKVNLTTAGVVEQGDPWLQEDIRGKWIPQFGVGAYLYTEKFFLGLSLPQILDSDIKQGKILNSTMDRSKMHFYLMGGYVIDFNPRVRIKPSFLIRMTQGARVSYDITSMVILYDRLWMGASYRNKDAVAAIVQYNVNNQLRVGYAYDFGTSALSGRSNGSHEISLSYDLELSAKKLKSPRYF